MSLTESIPWVFFAVDEGVRIRIATFVRSFFPPPGLLLECRFLSFFFFLSPAKNVTFLVVRLGKYQHVQAIASAGDGTQHSQKWILANRYRGWVN